MKKLFVFTIITFIAIGAIAQETFFPTSKGTVLMYKSFDKKGKQSSGTKYTIKNVKKDGDNVDITYLIEALDQKDKLVYKDEITIQQMGEVLYVDMSNFVNKAAFQQDGQIPADIKVTGNNMELPTNISPGETLPDANIEMTMKMGFMNMKMGAQVTDRKLEVIEDITVPAGTFKAYKFTSNVTATALGINMKTQNTEWYAKGIGMVKSESYDKKGKLDSYTELIELNK
jgi:hypothetical protein